jgi:hypothetical protein
LAKSSCGQSQDWLQHKIERKTLLALFFFWQFFRHFVDLENMISKHTKSFSEKHTPNWPGFEGKIKSKWSHFCNRFQQITKIF